MSAVYDYKPSARGDPLVQLMKNALELGFAVMTPERAAILKAFPFCELNFFGEKELTLRVLCSTEVT